MAIVPDSVFCTCCSDAVPAAGTGKKANLFARWVALALGCSALFVALAAAQEYISGVPDPARVIAAYEGPDSLDRTARQHAALRVVRLLVMDLSNDRVNRDQEGGRPYVRETPEEHRLQAAYSAAERQIHPEFDIAESRRLSAESRRLGAASPGYRWFLLESQYSMRDARFRDDVLHRFFSPEWVSGYLAAKGRLEARVAASTRNRDSPSGADSVAEEPEVPPFKGAPVPADERRFAMAIYDWCRGKPAEQDNPIAREMADREFSRQLDQIVRGGGSFRDWSGIILGISTDLGSSGLPDAYVTVSVDTVSSYSGKRTFAKGTHPYVSSKVSPRSPVYAVASRVQVGQRVFLSGRMIKVLGYSQSWTQGCGDVAVGIELMALRPAP